MNKKEKNVQAVHDAIRRGSLKEVQKQLKKVSGKLEVNCCNTSKQTPLHTAAIEGQLAILLFLLEKKKADANAKDRDDWTPLHCACHSGHLDAVDQLLSHGASVQLTTSNGSTPLHYFVRMPEQSTRPALYERLFRTMVRKGVDVNQKNLQGETPLHMAAFRGKDKSVSLLLWNQADPNITNKYGETCLHLATRAGFIKVIKQVIAKGAKADVAGSNGTPLEIARRCGHDAIAKLFEGMMTPEELEADKLKNQQAAGSPKPGGSPTKEAPVEPAPVAPTTAPTQQPAQPTQQQPATGQPGVGQPYAPQTGTGTFTGSIGAGQMPQVGGQYFGTTMPNMMQYTGQFSQVPMMMPMGQSMGQVPMYGGNFQQQPFMTNTGTMGNAGMYAGMPQMGGTMGNMGFPMMAGTNPAMPSAGGQPGQTGQTTHNLSHTGTHTGTFGAGQQPPQAAQEAGTGGHEPPAAQEPAQVPQKVPLSASVPQVSEPRVASLQQASGAYSSSSPDVVSSSEQPKEEPRKTVSDEQLAARTATRGSRPSASRPSSRPGKKGTTRGGLPPSARASLRKPPTRKSSRDPESDSKHRRTQSAAPKVHEPPKQLENYHIGEILGKGAFGSVFKGLDMNTGAMVAIKQVALAGVPPKELKAITAELNLLQRLENKHIVNYINYIKDEENMYFVMEFVEGGSLHSLLKKFGRIPEPLTARYMSQTLLGLDYLHRRGVIHRDIKCANILITKDGVVKLADFGIAAVPEGQEEASATLKTIRQVDQFKNQSFNKEAVGSPYWMAPEVILLKGASTNSDIWSLGCTIIELITGSPPYIDLAPMSALFAVVQDDHPELPSGMSDELHSFLMACFRKEPSERPTARELLKHPFLTKYVGDLSSTLPPLEQSTSVDGLMAVKQAAAPAPAPAPAPAANPFADALAGMGEAPAEPDDDDDDDVTDDPSDDDVTDDPTDDATEEETGGGDDEGSDVDPAFLKKARELREMLGWLKGTMAANKGKRSAKLRTALRKENRAIRAQYRDLPEARELHKEMRKLIKDCENQFPDDIPFPESDTDYDSADSFFGSEDELSFEEDDDFKFY